MTVMLDAFLIINALPLSFCKKRFPYFFHLLHRLYGVDATAGTHNADGSGMAKHCPVFTDKDALV